MLSSEGAAAGRRPARYSSTRARPGRAAPYLGAEIRRLRMAAFWSSIGAGVLSRLPALTTFALSFRFGRICALLGHPGDRCGKTQDRVPLPLQPVRFPLDWWTARDAIAPLPDCVGLWLLAFDLL